MGKAITKFCILLLLNNVVYFYSSAQELKRVGQATMTFLSIDPSARSVGMGEVSTCMDNDVNALFHNPAGMAKISDGSLSLNHTQWLIDIKQYSTAVAYNLGNIGTFGASAVIMDNGEMIRTIPDNSRQGYHEEGTFKVIQYCVGLGYGRQITDKFSIGGQVKYAYQDLGSTDITNQTGMSNYDTLRNVKNSVGRFALDFGTMYYLGFKDLRVAFSLNNFATSVRYAVEDFELPLTVKFGVAMNILSLFSGSGGQSLQFSTEIIHPNNYSDRIHVGIEYGFQELLYLRAGYRFNYDLAGLSAGVGLSPKALNIQIKLDYAYTYYGNILGSVHRISLGFSL